MAVKKATMYEIRVWPTANSYSKLLGKKLRTSKSATKLLKRLKKRGMDVFKVKTVITVAA
jgi:hypothetical protein